MKWIITLLLSLAMPAGASELTPHEAIFKTIHRAHNIGDLLAVDYKMVVESDKKMTREKIHELFRSIDPAKVRFAAYDSKAGAIHMIEPNNIRFTLQSRAFSSGDVITSVASYHVIVRIELEPNISP